MFLSFLFKEIRGLYSCLVDDIIQTKYTSAPSIKTFVEKLTTLMTKDLPYIDGSEKSVFDEQGEINI